MKNIKVERGEVSLTIGGQKIALSDQEARALLSALKSAFEPDRLDIYREIGRNPPPYFPPAPQNPWDKTGWNPTYGTPVITSEVGQ